VHIILLDPLGEEITRIKSIVVRRICKDEPCLKHIIKAINQDLEKKGLHFWQIPEANMHKVINTLRISHRKIYLTIPSLASCCL